MESLVSHFRGLLFGPPASPSKNSWDLMISFGFFTSILTFRGACGGGRLVSILCGLLSGATTSQSKKSKNLKMFMVFFRLFLDI